MPEMSPSNRGRGAWSDRRRLVAVDPPPPRPLGPCNMCGAAAVHAYLVGPRCAEHTPAALNGRPEPGSAAYTIPAPPPPPRAFPDEVCEPCVHCTRPVAPVNRALFGEAEHMACYPPPKLRAVPS